MDVGACTSNSLILLHDEFVPAVAYCRASRDYPEPEILLGVSRDYPEPARTAVVVLAAGWPRLSDEFVPAVE